jgi:ADP-ribose pyrophosphatase
MPEARPVPPHPGVEVLSDENVWDGRFPVQRIRFRQRRFDGAMSGIRTWELWRRGRAAALLPYDPVADAVVLIEQFRLPALAADIDPVLVELPAGLCDPGETHHQTLIREAREEMGIDVGRLVSVGDYLLSPGGSDEYVHVAVGEVAAPSAAPDGLIAAGGGLASEDEDIRVRLWPADRAIAAAFAGEFPNVVTTVALFWLATRRDWLRRQWSTPA